MRICWRHVNTIKNVSQVYFFSACVVEELNPGIPGFSSSITQAKVCCEEERSRDKLVPVSLKCLAIFLRRPKTVWQAQEGCELISGLYACSQQTTNSRKADSAQGNSDVHSPSNKASTSEFPIDVSGNWRDLLHRSDLNFQVKCQNSSLLIGGGRVIRKTFSCNLVSSFLSFCE